MWLADFDGIIKMRQFCFNVANDLQIVINAIKLRPDRICIIIF